MRFISLLLLFSICLLVPSLIFAKEDKFKCDNIYLLSDYFQNLDLHRFSPVNMPKDSFLISARSCKIDLANKRLIIEKVDSIVQGPLTTTPLEIFPTKLNVDLSWWNTVLILDSVEVHAATSRDQRQTYLTIYGSPLGENPYRLIVSRFRYN